MDTKCKGGAYSNKTVLDVVASHMASGNTVPPHGTHQQSYHRKKIHSGSEDTGREAGKVSEGGKIFLPLIVSGGRSCRKIFTDGGANSA